MIKIVVLQRQGRKMLARILIKQRREKRYHIRIRIPACIKVQGRFRTHSAKKKIIQIYQALFKFIKNEK